MLAAGRGRRLGRGPKAWITIDGETLLARACRVLRAGGVDEIVVVLPSATPGGPVPDGVQSAVNPDPASGPLGSVRAGLEAAGSAGPLVVFPVDHPDVTPSVVAALVQALANAPPGVARVVPTWEGRRGHPVGLTIVGCRAVAGAMTRDTLRSATAAAGGSVEVAVACPGVLRNLNHPGD